MEPIEINPCEACQRKLTAEGSLDYNSVNNCCYDLLASARGVYSNDEIRGNKNCSQCVDSQIPCLPGLDRDLKNTNVKVPPVFNQGQSTFFYHMRDTGDAEQALKMCRHDCMTNNLVKECLSRCNLAHDSLVKTKENFEVKQEEEKKTIVPEDDNPWVFWIVYGLVLFMLIFSLVVTIKSLVE